ncbi:DUF4157 domain-containing protein [Massilia antarctica]|uniref:DUF4157 domain-containing protein n=1 Tax=Massilia antarctica TaxID=2765360 RepID=A0AA48WC55_9BURK|nr:DUF4157 domain-containing protein [Massilia antarctica]QPI48565.1 DUF4157 domain-containing protein [Massilia antarctica]
MAHRPTAATRHPSLPGGAATPAPVPAAESAPWSAHAGNFQVQRAVAGAAASQAGAAGHTHHDGGARLAPAASDGQPLPPAISHEYGQFFGTDLSSVRVFTDPAAAGMARDLNAQAFTQRGNIYFAQDRYQPHTVAGRKLLAHELAHTRQGSGAQLRRAPGPAGAAPPPLTLDSLIRTGAPGFTDAALDAAYQSYRRSEKDPVKPRLWALRQTSGAPRERLEQLLGPDYAKGQLTGAAAAPVDVGQALAPAGYDQTRAAEDMGALSARPQALTDRLSNMLDTPIQNNQVNAGHLNILQGNVAEVLARPLLEQALQDVRRDAPDAQLFLGVRARVLRSDGTPSDPVLFSDGLVAAVRPAGLQIFKLAEIKSGEQGGVQGQEQIHRWIELHSSDQIEILLPGVARTFRLSDTVREVVGLARAPRLLIAPRGASFTTERSGHGVAAPVERRELAQSGEEIAYLTRLVAQQIIQMQQARQLLAQAQAQQLTPKPLASLGQLQDPDVVNQLLSENQGTALIQGQLYRVSIEGKSTRVRLLPAAPISVPRLAAPGMAPQALPATPPQPAQTALPAPGGAGGPLAQPVPSLPQLGTGGPVPALRSPGAGATGGPLAIPFTPPGSGIVPPNVINFSGKDIVIGGRTIAPTPGELPRAGELVVIGYDNFWVVGDMRTREPIAGVFEGGQWYRVVAGGRVLPVDADGRVRTEVEPIPFEHLPQVAQTRPPAGPGGAGGSRFGGGTRLAAGGLGLLIVANEILGPIGQVLQSQRRNIALGEAEGDFWIRFGGNPELGVWSQTDRTQLPQGSRPDTAVFGSPSYGYVIDIDVAAFKATLPTMIGNYRDYLLFLDLAKTLGSIIEEPQMPRFPSPEERRAPRRYRAFVNREDRAGRRYHDITDTLLAIRERTLGQLDDEMRAKVRGLPAGEQGNIFRLKSGSATPLFRSASGAQPILSDQQLLGDDPWVRPLGRRVGGGAWNCFMRGNYADRVLVEPANADAQRGTVLSAYAVKRPIDQVLDEVSEAGRPITQRQPPEGRLDSFVAGPEPGNSRFGETRYYRHPDMPEQQTAAIGELRQFWVNADDIEPVVAAKVSDYATPPPSTP